MVVIQVELCLFVYLINSDTLLTTVHLFLNTVSVLDWKSVRLKCIMPFCFLLQSHFVVSAQQLLSFTRQSTLANTILTNIMQVGAWNALAHRGFPLPWEPAQASVLGDEGYRMQTGLSQLSQPWPFRTNWYPADQQICSLHNIIVANITSMIA